MTMPELLGLQAMIDLGTANRALGLGPYGQLRPCRAGPTPLPCSPRWPRALSIEPEGRAGDTRRAWSKERIALGHPEARSTPRSAEPVR